MPAKPLVVIAALFALAIASPATADISTEDAAQIEKSRGLQVLSSDGAFVGVIDGASISGNRAALFLRPTSRSIFRPRGKDVTILTEPSEITLKSGVVVLNSTEQRIKTRARLFYRDDQVIEVVLPRR